MNSSKLKIREWKLIWDENKKRDNRQKVYSQGNWKLLFPHKFVNKCYWKLRSIYLYMKQKIYNWIAQVVLISVLEKFLWANVAHFGYSFLYFLVNFCLFFKARQWDTRNKEQSHFDKWHRKVQNYKEQIGMQ